MPLSWIKNAKHSSPSGNAAAIDPPQRLVWMSARSVAEMLDVSEATIWRWTKTLPSFPKPVKLSPGCTRFSSEQIHEFLRSAGVRS